MFKCDMCGECCRHLDSSDIYRGLDRGDGVCRFLEGNKCSIYSKRPLLCRVDESYEQLFSSVMTKEEYYNANYAACRELKKLKSEKRD